MIPAIFCEDVSVHYGQVRALERASFVLEQGLLCGLIGVNGSGKSTLFKAVMGVESLAGGRVEVLGKRPAVARSAGLLSYMPQSEGVDWTFPVSVREVVEMGRYRTLGATRRLGQKDKDAVAVALERVQLAELAERQIGELSGGQKKRVFMARALAQEAQIFLLDEPFAGVDRVTEGLLIEVLKELREAGKTVLVATHDLQRLPSYADEALLVKNRVLMHDVPERVLEPQNLAAAFGMGTLGEG